MWHDFKVVVMLNSMKSFDLNSCALKSPCIHAHDNSMKYVKSLLTSHARVNRPRSNTIVYTTLPTQTYRARSARVVQPHELARVLACVQQREADSTASRSTNHTSHIRHMSHET